MKLIFSNSHFNAIILHAAKLNLKGYRVFSWSQGKAKKTQKKAFDILLPNIPIINSSKFKFFMFFLGCFADTIIIGDYRSRSGRYLTNIRLFLRGLGWPLKTYFVDDGSNSLVLKSSPQYQLSRNIDGFYTCYDLERKNTVFVDPSETLRSINTITLDAAVLLLGTAEAASGNLSNDKYLEAILEKKQLYPEIVYKPHRLEKPEFIEILRYHSVKLLDSDVPLEFFDLSQVNKIYTTGTTSQIWLNRLYKNLNFERLEFGAEWMLDRDRGNGFDELWNATR